MVATARFSIGIDLGTTNSAMAFAALAGDGAADIFLVPQWNSSFAVVEAPTLPSFLYRPEAAVAARLQASRRDASAWVIGALAREKAHEMPGRVAHSAKSWLCHHAADREAPFLPWGSQDVPAAEKISPLRATSLILGHLRNAWNTHFAHNEPAFHFDAQEITIAVPASFDAAAQRLTLTAAAEAGYPATIRLLEEPQAAFYDWLAQHDCETALWGRLPAGDGDLCHVLVVDVGGGTTDFSLFEVRRSGALPKIRRLAVGEHILLGGDNIDLALAHLAEPRLVDGGGKLSSVAWDDLVARCRDLKERVLSAAGPADETFAVALPGRGAGLTSGSRSALFTRGEIANLVLEGFFPPCEADAPVRRTFGALKEWGLPFARDSRITCHLAHFLRGRPRCDAVLFNGGSLYPPVLRARICDEIAKWQDSAPPLVLANAAPDLAVARGAAHFGRLLHTRAARIEAGAARAIFLEASSRRPAAGEMGDGAAATRSLVCLLPRGAPPEATFTINDLALSLRLNRPVRFQTYASARHDKSRAGDVISSDDPDLHPLPPLQTVARLDTAADNSLGAKDSSATLPISLTAKLNELGLLQVTCHSAAPRIRQSWPLDFDLRPEELSGGAAHRCLAPGDTPPATTSPAPPVQGGGTAAGPNATRDALASARRRLEAAFAAPAGPRNKLTAARLLQDLEEIFGAGKSEWNGPLVRALWPSLEASAARRRQSVEHEEAWLILAGFLLRPGFGAAADAARIDRLWQIRDEGLCFPGKRTRLQEYILWRRVAGGLSRERQEAVLAAELDKLRQPKGAPPELIRLAGALERLGHDVKTELVERFIAAAVALAGSGGHVAPYLAALGLLLNRAPFHAGPESVVSPRLVEQAFEALRRLDWSAPELSELPALFLRAARVIDNRSLDVPASLRQKIADKLEKQGIAPLKTAKLRAFIPVAAAERHSLFGEQLPPGLILSTPA